MAEPQSFDWEDAREKLLATGADPEFKRSMEQLVAEMLRIATAPEADHG